jgi:hypothetical protein
MDALSGPEIKREFDLKLAYCAHSERTIQTLLYGG